MLPDHNRKISKSKGAFFAPKKENMAAVNTIAYAQLFQKALDEKMVQELTSGWMEANASQVQYSGGNTVRIAKMSMEGLGNYNRSTGFDENPVVLEWETHTFSMDRGKSFSLDAMDEDESAFTATASSILGEFQRTKVAPEVDAYRYEKIFTIANAASKTSNYIPAKATIFEELTGDISKIQDIIGENEPLVIVMSIPAGTVLDNADKIEKKLDVIEFSMGGITTKVKSLDNIPIIRVSSSRFKSDFTFSATDGFSASATAMNLNWIIIARRAAIAVVKTDKIRMFSPGQNINADAYKVDMRKYHDMWIPDNKVDGIWVNYYSTDAPALTATVAQGSASGTTKFTATAGSVNTLEYTLTTAADPGYFNTIPGGTAYTSGDDIAATAGKYLNMFEVNAAGRVVKFKSQVLAAGDIK
jgi:hypothetical protein